MPADTGIPGQPARISFEISRDLHNRVNNTNIPWGSKSLIITKLLEMLCDTLEENGIAIIGLILSGHMRLVLTKEGKDALLQRM